MSHKTFSRLAAFIHSELGIKMPDMKRPMLQGRLQKRLRHLGIASFDDYAEYFFSPEGMKREVPHLIDAVTTNKTDFFREPRHYDILVRVVLPCMVESRSMGVPRRLNVWSAACSTGEEPYTLAMVLSEFGERIPGFRFCILATDISSKVLEEAMRGIYEEERIEPVPPVMRKKYLLRGKGDNKGLVRIVPELRSLVRFQRLNLMDKDYGIRDPMDIVFCRNVIIYFDRPTQSKVLNSLVGHLKPGGYLFMGHSETLNGLEVPLVPIALTVYRKTE
ncbi:MAG: protein-glutamate O-methyltransferase [Thermodesulfobacteriota bacterium]